MNEFRDRGDTGAHLPPSLRDLSWAPGERYLGLPPAECAFADATVLILPVPYEATVSYMGGTRFGPRAILHASRYLEVYDEVLDGEPYRAGIHTLPELMLSGAGPETALGELRAAYEAVLDTERFVVLLGGEHSVSGPPILAHAERLGDRGLSVLQLDAHADLRADYEGTPFSHASVMHRVHDRVTLVPVGIRSLTAEERALIRRAGIPTTFAHELGTDGWIDRVMDSLGPDVYITVDVDYFDPALVPSTGTPEPGGGQWYPTLELLQRVFRERHVVGCDLVELAPIPGLVAPDFLVAKLLYKLIGYLQQARAGS